MWIPLVIVAVVALVVAGWVDLRARRHGIRLRDGDEVARNMQRLGDAERRMRPNQQHFGGGGGGGFGL